MTDSTKALNIIVRGAGFVFLGMFISKLVSYFYRVIIARIGPEDYGVFSLAFAIVGVVSIFPALGLDSGVLRYVSYYSGIDLRKMNGAVVTALKFAVPFGLLFTVVLFLFSDTISLFYFQDYRMSLILKIMSISVFLITLSNIFLSSLKALNNIGLFVGIKQITENIVKLVCTVILMFFGFGVVSAAVGYTLSFFFTFLLSLYFIRKYFKFDKFVEYKREMLFYSIPLLLNVLLNQVIVWTDVLMLGIWRNAYEIGIYNAALPTVTIMSIIPGGILSLFLPVITSLLANKKITEFKSVFIRASKWLFFGNLMIYCFIMVFSKDIVTLFFGQEYHSAYVPLLILAQGYIVFYSLHTTPEVLNSYKKSYLVMMNTGMAAGSNIILNYLLIPTYGMIGGAIATAFAMILFVVLSTIEAYYFTKVLPFSFDYIKAFLAGGLTIFVLYFLRESFMFVNYLNIIYGVVFTFLIYVSFMLLFNGVDKQDFAIIKKIRSKFFSMFRI